MWRGVVRPEDGYEHAAYVRDTGFHYPEDGRFLVEKEPKAAHFEVADEIPPTR